MTVANPKVSVIVPNYNHARFLPERLDSILNQTYQDFELILLDDHSTDNSVEVLQRYADHPKVSHFIVNETNSGSPFAQWKKGIELAQGEFIWIAESDDVADPRLLQFLLDGRDSETVLSYCRSHVINEDGLSNGRLNPPKQRWSKDFTNDGRAEVSEFLSQYCTIPNASAVVFRKSAAMQVDIPVEMSFAGDWVFWITVLRLGKVAYTAIPLNSFRQHANNTRAPMVTKRHRKRIVEYIMAIEAAGHRLSLLYPLRHMRILPIGRGSLLPLWIMKCNDISLQSRVTFLMLSPPYFAVRFLRGI